MFTIRQTTFMNSKGGTDSASANVRRFGAFTIIEIIVVVAVIFVLSVLLVPARAKSRVETHAVIDLNNVHQILRAVHLYAAHNGDFLPHPTWGSVPAGPTGWLYGARMADGTLPISATTAQFERVISNQVVYFKAGQLARYLDNDPKLVECPADVMMRRSGVFKSWYAQRPVKLGAFTFTGAICGYGAPKTIANADLGATYKLSGFRPSNFLMWEADETKPFNFNDAASNQENAGEGTSFRHTAGAGTSSAKGSGGAMRGTFGGDAAYINPRLFTKLRTSAPPNDLRCGPGYQ